MGWDDEWHVGDRPRTPLRVQEQLRSRLPENSWHLLRVAAVLGRRFDLSELAAMMRRSVVELLPAVDALLDDECVEWAGDHLAFRTDLVWWAALDALPAAVHDALRADLDRVRATGRSAAPAPAQETPADELSRAIALVRAALARPGAARLDDDLHALLANLLLLEGQSAPARVTAERVLAAPDDRLAGEPAGTRVAAKALSGDPDLASTVVRETEKLVEDNPGFPLPAASAADARACLAGEGAAQPKVEGVPDRNLWASFSDVEQAIARLVAQGMTNRQIATRVRLSPHTVNYHLRVLFRKLGISSRAELVRHVPNSTAA